MTMQFSDMADLGQGYFITSMSNLTMKRKIRPAAAAAGGGGTSDFWVAPWINYNGSNFKIGLECHVKYSLPLLHSTCNIS